MEIEITKEMKMDLASLILKHIRENFKVKHITKNLINTINIAVNDDGNFVIDIPAQMYDLEMWNKKKVFVRTGSGSYANLVNTTGGFSKTHKDYIEISIDKAISEWLAKVQASMGDERFVWKVKKS